MFVACSINEMCVQCTCVMTVICMLCVIYVGVVCACSVRNMCVSVCGERERDANKQDLLIQAIMECAKIPSLIVVLGFWSRTFGHTWEWAQIGGWEVDQEGRELVPPLGFFY